MANVSSTGVDIYSTNLVTPQEGKLSWANLVNSSIANGIYTEAVGNERGFWGRMARWNFGDLTFINATIRGVSLHSDHTQCSVASSTIWLAFCLSGSIEFETPQSRTSLKNQQLGVINIRQNYGISFSKNADLLWVQVPRSYFESQLDRLDEDVFILEAGRGTGYFAATTLLEMFRQAGYLGVSSSPVLVPNTMGFVSAAIDEQLVPVRLPRYHSATLSRIKSYIEQQLDDETLSPVTIAAALKMSPRYINKLFERENTSLMRWVHRKRLQKAATLMRQDSANQRSIAEVATACGFKNFSHFSTSFREHFNMTPSEFRKSNQFH